MMNFRNLFTVCLIVALPIATSCSKEQESTPSSGKETAQTKSEPSASSTPAQPAAGQGKGTIAGKVVFKGKYSQGKLPVGKDKEVCGDAKADPALIVANDGGIKNAVIQVAGLKEGRTPAKEAELDQVKCEYVPHVLVIPAGGAVKIKNSVGILHNVHTVSKDNKPFNRAQPKFLKEISETFSKPEMIAVRCDVHGWMSGWIVVTDNAFYEVSQADGAFKLADLPAGKHSVEVWHEKLGKLTQEVEVKAAESINVTFEFQANK
jgi:plastocyanin